MRRALESLLESLFSQNLYFHLQSNSHIGFLPKLRPIDNNTCPHVSSKISDNSTHTHTPFSRVSLTLLRTCHSNMNVNKQQNTQNYLNSRPVAVWNPRRCLCMRRLQSRQAGRQAGWAGQPGWQVEQPAEQAEVGASTHRTAIWLDGSLCSPLVAGGWLALVCTWAPPVTCSHGWSCSCNQSEAGVGETWWLEEPDSFCCCCCMF